MKLSIYRYDPDKDEKPYMKDYDVQLEHSDRMLLDALVKVKVMDDSRTGSPHCSDRAAALSGSRRASVCCRSRSTSSRE